MHPTGKILPRRINQRRGPAIKFTGELLAEMDFQTGQGWDMRLELYETLGGAYIAVSKTDVETRADIIDASDDTMAMQCEVMDAFDWHPQARGMLRDQLGWQFIIEVE